MNPKGKSFKRLELRMPADHPVWDLPHGERSRIVRKWLEIGSRLAAMESSLTRIEASLASASISIMPADGELPKEDKASPFDVGVFLSHFG